MHVADFRFTLLILLSASGCTDRVKDDPPSAAPDRPHRVILKLQDSTGWVVRSLHPDSLGTNLDHLVRAARSTPVDDSLEAKLAEEKGFHDERGVGFCGCETPSDSLLILLPDGSVEAYLLHCSSIYREAPERSEELDLTDVQRLRLSRRWDLVREKYCPKGFGCSDGAPEDHWDYQVELWEDSAWEEERYETSHLGWMMSEILKERQAKIADLTLRLRILAQGGTVVSVSVDSAAPAHKALAEELARRIPGSSRKLRGWDGEKSLRMHLWNFRHE